MFAVGKWIQGLASIQPLMFGKTTTMRTCWIVGFTSSMLKLLDSGASPVSTHYLILEAASLRDV